MKYGRVKKRLNLFIIISGVNLSNVHQIVFEHALLALTGRGQCLGVSVKSDVLGLKAKRDGFAQMTLKTVSMLIRRLRTICWRLMTFDEDKIADAAFKIKALFQKLIENNSNK